MGRIPAPQKPAMPWVEHLVELRDRALRAFIVFFILLLPLAFFAKELYTFLADPLMAHLPEGASMIATEVASPFFTPFKLAMMCALALAMPVILHQIWGFISPGLYQREKRVATPLLISSIILFYAGMAFAYFVVFPVVFNFLANSAPEGIIVSTDINSYLDFVLALFFAFGVAFEMPVAIVLLVATGVVMPSDLTSKRAYVFLGCFVVGMFLTPPDIISQTLLAIPMYALFEGGIVMARWLVPGYKEVEKQRAEMAAED